MIARVRSLVQRNLPQKAAAVLVAVVLWVVVMGEQNPVIDGSYTVPVTLSKAPSGFRITHDGGDEVKIKVRAQRSFFMNYGDHDFKAYLDLSGAMEGKQSIPVETELPQEFELVEVQPEHITVTLDPYIERHMPVALIVTGTVAKGATVDRIDKSFSMVTAVGPRSEADRADRVIGYVGLAGNSDDFTLQVPLTPIDEDGREVSGVRLHPSTIEAKVLLRKGIISKMLAVQADVETPEGYEAGKVTVTPAQTEVTGSESLLAQMTAVKTEKISLSVEDMDSTIIKRTVKLALPADMRAKDAEISVIIEARKKPDAPQEEESR